MLTVVVVFGFTLMLLVNCLLAVLLLIALRRATDEVLADGRERRTEKLAAAAVARASEQTAKGQG